jgi:hypothetical protein
LQKISRVTALLGILIGAWGIALMALDAFILGEPSEGFLYLGLMDGTPLAFKIFLIALIPLSILLWMRPFRPVATWLDFQFNRDRYRGAYSATADGRHSVVIKTSRGVHFWGAYSNFLETDDLFILIYGPWAYAVIPKRGFHGTEDINRFRGILRGKIGG